MSNKIVFAVMAFFLGISGVSGMEKCVVKGTVSEGTKPCGLVIKRPGEDPKNSPYRLTVKDGRFECEVSADEISKYTIVDLGEMLEKGSTHRTAEFFVEDGAVIRAVLDGDGLTVESDGVEFQKWRQTEQEAIEKFEARFMALGDSGDESNAEYEALYDEYQRWMLGRYAENPSLGFMLELGSRLDNFHFNDTMLGSMLDIYHEKYETLYPGHSIHRLIADNENSRQIFGRKYHDYNIRTLEGEKVTASSYYGGKLTLVVCWASWCLPCRRDAVELIPVYEKYRDKGLSVIGIAHEFDSTDAVRKAASTDRYPWPTLVDLDDEFEVFRLHGTSNSALFLVDEHGTIIGVMDSPAKVESRISEIFGNRS